MKNITFSIALLISTLLFGQKTIIVNGGQFGNPAENVNVMLYDTQTKTSTVIDTIHTQSVQEILMEGDFAYVAAQDSIIKYDLSLGRRVAANAFPGVSTKALALAPNNELLVSNWYGKSAHNLYVFNRSTLALIDSIDAKEGVTSMLVAQTGLLVNQNSSTGAPNYADTLGYILAIDIASRTVLDTIRITNYTGDIGELILKPASQVGFYSINSVSNTYGNFSNPIPFPPYFTTTTVNPNQDLKVSSKSQYFVNGDTAFLKMNQGIGVVDLTNLSTIDPLLIDTVVTGFTYDTANFNFYVTQTDFFSYMSGKAYKRDGSFLESFTVGVSPEVVSMFYNITTGVQEINTEKADVFSLYPNPASDQVTIELDKMLNDNSNAFILNVNGQIVREMRLQNGVNRLSVANLDKGVYLITVNTGSEFYTKKLIVE